MSKAEQEALKLLDELGITDFPLPVEDIAHRLGAELAFEPFEGNISGMLFRDGPRTVIGINTAHPATRQRFSVAHELAHLRLHPGKRMILDHVVRVDFRDERSSAATDRQEIQANAFAAELLMPREWLRREVARRLSKGEPTDSDAFVEELASAFKVSKQAMEFRLTNLGIRRGLL